MKSLTLSSLFIALLAGLAQSSHAQQVICYPSSSGYQMSFSSQASRSQSNVSNQITPQAYLVFPVEVQFDKPKTTPSNDRLANIEKRLEAISKKLDTSISEVKKLNDRFDAFDAKLTDFDKRLKALEEKVRGDAAPEVDAPEADATDDAATDDAAPRVRNQIELNEEQKKKIERQKRSRKNKNPR
jgi:tetrahydromethanopterin S-methyltransferase subunit G